MLVKKFKLIIFFSFILFSLITLVVEALKTYLNIFIISQIFY